MTAYDCLCRRLPVLTLPNSVKRIQEYESQVPAKSLLPAGVQLSKIVLYRSSNVCTTEPVDRRDGTGEAREADSYSCPPL